LSISKISYGKHELEIIHNPKLKNSYIKINSNMTITVKTPYKSNNFIFKLLEEKNDWIEKQLLKSSNLTSFSVTLEDEVLLFGEIYSIDTEEACYLRERLNKIKNTNNENILKCYDDFYKYMSNEYLTQRISEYSQIMKLGYTGLKFRKMKSRWGSCNSRREITLNTQLIKVKKDLIDYVIVHELAHLVHMNHSKKFHNLVEEYLPNSKLLRKKLKNVRLLD
jgi:predicted metal-dependent hydrolase